MLWNYHTSVDFQQTNVSEGIVEPFHCRLAERGILVGKSLVNLSSDQVPMRIANLQNSCAAKCNKPVSESLTVRKIQSQNCETLQDSHIIYKYCENHSKGHWIPCKLSWLKKRLFKRKL